jgi:hypothetical protein
MESHDYQEPQPEYYPEPDQDYYPDQEEPDQTPYYDDEDPEMQLNAVFTEQQKLRYNSGQCIGCGSSQHFISKCPNPDRNLSRNPPPRKPNPPPRRFPPPGRRPFVPNNRNPPPNNAPRKISVLEIQNMIRDLPLEDRIEFREAYVSDSSLKPFGDF